MAARRCLLVALLLPVALSTVSTVASAAGLSEKEVKQLINRCAPKVAEDTLLAVVRTESSMNPYAIGVVGKTIKQPTNFISAMSAIAELETEGANYSVGLAQINKKNFERLGITAKSALDACTNLAAASVILSECYERAANEQDRLKKALSCYYSGNFSTGFEHGYVNRVEKNAKTEVPSLANDSFISHAKEQTKKQLF